MNIRPLRAWCVRCQMQPTGLWSALYTTTVLAETAGGWLTGTVTRDHAPSTRPGGKLVPRWAAGWTPVAQTPIAPAEARARRAATVLAAWRDREGRRERVERVVAGWLTANTHALRQARHILAARRTNPRYACLQVRDPAAQLARAQKVAEQLTRHCRRLGPFRTAWLRPRREVMVAHGLVASPFQEIPAGWTLAENGLTLRRAARRITFRADGHFDVSEAGRHVARAGTLAEAIA